MLLLRRALLGVLLVAALIPPAGAAAVERAPSLEVAWSTYLPEHLHGTSVAIGPDGVPWFGFLGWEAEPPTAVGYVRSRKPRIEPFPRTAASEPTAALQFDSGGALWFAIGSSAIARRDPDGTVTEFPLPEGGAVNAMAFGPEGGIWFVRGDNWETAQAEVGRLTPAGAITQFPLEAGSHPASIALGPDGALWFTEETAGRIGRITTGGEVQLFPLAPDSRPQQIVAGPDGALWFGEDALPRLYGKVSDRIGHITVDGQLSDLPIPFGRGTSRLAADPHGVIWFTTVDGEFSSISASGNVGARGCVGDCRTPIESLAVASGGALWFAAGIPYCGNCGGGSGLLLAAQPTKVGRIPSGALRPADPTGPPARDPYAAGQPKPPPPIARTGRPEEVEGSFARLTGYVNPRGFPTNARFKWGRTKTYGHLTFLFEPPFVSGSEGRAVGDELFGLCPETTYHYEVVAYGPGGRAFGGDRTFTTGSQKFQPKHCRARRSPPASAARASAKEPHISVKTLPAYGVNEEEAVLDSRINPHGSAGTYRFQWGRTKRYGHVVPEEPPEESFYAGDEGQEIEELVEGLRPGTVYHYRVVAYSHGHKFFGQDETLRTWPSHPEPRTPHAKSPGRAATIDDVFSTHFPRYFQGQTVALAPDGTPWFGVDSEYGPTTLATVRSKRLVRKPQSSNVGSRGLTTGLSFDRAGNLWFGSYDGSEVTIARRAPDGSLSTFALPGTEIVSDLTSAAAGQVWFVRSEYRHRAAVDWITPAGVLGEIELASGSEPSSITIGPDGAAWFAEERAGQIGRIDAGGQVQLFPLGAGVEPRQLVAGPDGALWFTENGAKGAHPASTDRIGRMTTAGEVTQFPLSFGFGTRALAVDPRGFLWFGTDEGEIASISPTGALGGRGCISRCGTPILSIAPTPDRSIWFAGGIPDCSGCSDSAAGLNLVEGTIVGKVPPDGVRPPADFAAETPLPAESPPHLTVKTRQAYGVEESEALLAGFINPHGSTATFRFQWGKSKKYGHITYAPEQPVYPGYKGEEVEEFIDGLKPGTVYHFRLIGYSHSRRFFGQDETLKTLPFHSRY